MMADYYGGLAVHVGSDNDSELSDVVDPAQVASLVEGMEDLDAGLFSLSSKARPPVAAPTVSPKKSSLKGVGNSSEKRPKSRVSFDSPNKVAPVFMAGKTSKSYDEADPLADLLSDEDSASSRKETNKKVVESPVKAVLSGTAENGAAAVTSTVGDTKRDKSKVISDLFGLSSDDVGKETSIAQPSAHSDESKVNQPLSLQSSDWLGIKSPAKTSSANVVHSEGLQNKAGLSKVAASVKTVGSEDDDLLEKMGFGDKKVPKLLDPTTGKVGPGFSKQKSVMDDLFGGGSSVSSRGVGTFISSSPDKSADGKDVLQTPNPALFGNYAPSVPTTRESRRSAGRHALSVADPLGILSSASQAIGQERAFDVSSASAKTSDQLGTSSATDGRRDPKSQVTTTRSSVQLTSGVDPGGVSVVRVQNSPVHQVGNPASGTPSLPEWLGGPASTKKEEAVASTSNVQSTLSDAAVIPEHFQTGDGGVLGLSLVAGARLDQEVASSLQRQEAQLLAALQVKEQHEQLASLHRRQHELLLRQEGQLKELVERQVERQRQVEAHLARQQERIASHIQALLSQPVVLPPPELPHVPSTLDEATQSSQHVAAGNHIQVPRGVDLAARHREEVDRVEGFYKRHIVLLESTLERLECRLRAENARLEEDCQARILKLQEEQQHMEKLYKQKIATLQEQQLADMKHLKELYQQEVDDLREHHARVAAVEHDNSAQTRSLQLLCEQLGRSGEQLSALEARADERQRSELDVRDAYLHAKEAELKSTREVLERQKSASEEERKRLVGLVADLELRAAERQAEVDTRAWELRQEAASLEARTRALEGERQRTQAQLEHDRRQIQQLKQGVLHEQKQVQQQLKEEQLKLSAEKSRLEALARLHLTQTPAAALADIEQVQVEAETAMQVALQSAQQTDAERVRLLDQKRQLAVDQRRLQQQEKELAIRSQELDILAQMAAATREEGLRTLEECREIQHQHAATLSDQQRHASQLKERERRLAEEKASLSQERAAWLRSKQQESLCSLCRMLLEHSGQPALPTSNKSQNKHFVDPEQVILRLTGERDQDDNSHNYFPSSLISK